MQAVSQVSCTPKTDLECINVYEWSEDLLLLRPLVLGNVGVHSRLDKEALAVDLGGVTTQLELTLTLACGLQEAFDTLELNLIRLRSLLCFWKQWITFLGSLEVRYEGFFELVCNAFMDVYPAIGNTCLAHEKLHGADGGSSGLRDIGVCSHFSIRPGYD